MNKRIALVAEKTIATYLQAFVALLLVSAEGPLSLEVVESAAIASIPAALTAALAWFPTNYTGPFWVSLAGNVVRTFCVTFVTYIAAVPVFTLDKSLLTAAATAAIAAALAAVKGGLASKVGSPETPNLTT